MEYLTPRGQGPPLRWVPKTFQLLEVPSLSTPSRMARNPCLHVQRILASIAEAGDGSIRSTEVGDSDKGSVLSVVEMLDRVSGFLLPSC